jgi:hypothetical protein
MSTKSADSQQLTNCVIKLVKKYDKIDADKVKHFNSEQLTNREQHKLCYFVPYLQATMDIFTSKTLQFGNYIVISVQLYK